VKTLVAAALVLAACGGAARAPVFVERAPGGLEAIDPGTADPALLSARACAGCHRAQHAEWGSSRHALAWTNGIFRREYREQPRRWCVNCHAPLAPQVAEVAAGGGALADEGVGCAACHLRAGRVVARAHHDGSPHDTLADPAFGGAALCAGCHEFTFPMVDGDDEVRALSTHPMQATVSQFAAGPYRASAAGCRACHAPEGGHAYPGGHDVEMLRRALELSVCRDGAVAVIGLANRGAGHSVPTGDVHRHINLRVWRSAAPERLVEIFLGRRFEPAPDGGKLTTWDSTLGAGERRSYRVDPASLGAEGPLRVELDFVYTADENPVPARAPGEPTVQVVSDLSRAPEELPACR
jgi:hypothetical protein